MWFRSYLWGDNWILCDQLAMMAALSPESVTQSSQQVASVELAGHATRGMMVLDRRPAQVTADHRRNVTIIEKIDRARLQDTLVKAFSLNVVG